MRQKTINVYKFDELPDRAKEHVINKWRENSNYAWASENLDTLKAFESIFPIRAIDWAYGDRNFIFFQFTADADTENLTGHRLSTYLWNNYREYIYKGKYFSTSGHYDEKKGYHYKSRHSRIILDSCCPLTGYCIDDDILEPVFKFMKKPDDRNFYDLMDDCLQAWISACNLDFEYQNSDAAIIETIEINEYEFYENGEVAA